MEADLVLIEWEDSRQPSSAWRRVSSLEPASAVRCKTVGWLIEDGDVVVVAQNLGDTDADDPQVSGVMAIPRRCIRRRRRLAAARR